MQIQSITSTAACLVLYGNSVFLAGIKTELERAGSLELITMEAGGPDVADLILARRPRALLFDLTMPHPDFAIPLLRQQPGLLLIGVDPSSDDMLVLSSHPTQAVSMRDLKQLILQESEK
jgi:hypothetical protein